MEFVYGKGVLCQEKQPFFKLGLATTTLKPLYARLLSLYPAFPLVNLPIDTVYQLAPEPNSVHLLKQKTLEGPAFLLVGFLLEPLAKVLNVALKTFHLLLTLRIWNCLDVLHQIHIDFPQFG